MRVRETVELARPPGDVLELLAEPERRPAGRAWRDLTREDDGYRGTLHASAGAIEVDFDCRLQVTREAEGQSVWLRGIGVSPRLGFTVDGRLAVRERDGGSAVDVDIDVRPAGTLAGLGQRRLGEQARRLIADFVGA
jgi:carbon monoxide dehydrogenase subunit G